MGLFRRATVTADVGAGFLALETAAHQAALEASAGTGRQVSRVAAELTVHAEPSGVVVLSWNNRNVGLAPEEQRLPLAAQAAAAGRGRLVTDAEVFRDAGVWRVWVGPLPRPTDAVQPEDTVAPKPPSIAGIPLQRPDPA
ncbi:hypothetical protein C8046_13945 [Serinibacter arcticus]|uniref:Uncharacterized protein n=1 Tax=Serinibacter arcticus TaxID=1655435 RepID=A0A2U1ZXA7_9MICO|nr:hypothetical protein [Serinibacter arcticus]PWD51580.1 hypothetical protein C8046_13945 [Serinibacter arcticus]